MCSSYNRMCSLTTTCGATRERRTALYVCLICVPYMCLICVPYMFSYYLWSHERAQNSCSPHPTAVSILGFQSLCLRAWMYVTSSYVKCGHVDTCVILHVNINQFIVSPCACGSRHAHACDLLKLKEKKEKKY